MAVPRGIKKPCPNNCGRDITTYNMRSHLEACSGGTMTVDTKEEYVVRMLADGKTPTQIAIALNVAVGTIRQKMTIMRTKWGASTTAHLMVILAREGQV